jgi:shikimate kinase
MNLYLTGMPGSGKTTWGKKIATTYHLPFFDLDHQVEQQYSKTITLIFEEEGEAGFRRLESEALRTLVFNNPQPLVLSCGGGTTINNGNFSLLKNSGYIVYLKATTETLLNNLRKSIASRPLLNPSDLESRLNQLYEQRRNVYDQADYTLQVENLSIQHFDPILQLCTKQL